MGISGKLTGRPDNIGLGFGFGFSFGFGFQSRYLIQSYVVGHYFVFTN